MTEDEAKTKWCPFARIMDWNGPHEPTGNNRGVAAVNRAQDDDAGTRCIASACMAWRERKRLVLRTEPWPEKETTGAPVMPSGADVVIDGGYCGLAGAPQ